MTTYLVSLLMGLIVGVVYGLVQVRSPAPPLVALVGLLGMVLGEGGVTTARHHLAPQVPRAEQSAPVDGNKPG